jgi:hypothetical protein
VVPAAKGFSRIKMANALHVPKVVLGCPSFRTLVLTHALAAAICRFLLE